MLPPVFVRCQGCVRTAASRGRDDVPARMPGRGSGEGGARRTTTPDLSRHRGDEGGDDEPLRVPTRAPAGLHGDTEGTALLPRRQAVAARYRLVRGALRGRR